MPTFSHKTITQGRKTIVFGMPWYTVEDEESPRKVGVALAKEVQAKFDLIVARKENAPQFGLATTAEGAKSGAYSAAAIVADTVVADSWIYVLEIESSIWICCGREGYILPAGDRIYENRNDAHKAFLALNPSSFKSVYLPASWKKETAHEDDDAVASDVEETDILDFIEYNPPKWGKLAPLSSTGTILKAVAVAALLGGVAFGGWSYVSNEATTEMTPEQRAFLLQQEAERLANLSQSEKEARWARHDAVRPWHNAPASGGMLKTCLQEIRKMPTRPVGYEVTTIHCSAGSVSASVERSTGYSTWLTEWAKGHGDLHVSTNSTGDQGFLTRDFSSPTARGEEKIFAFDGISRKILEIGQIEGASIELDSPKPRLIPEEPEYKPYYAKSSYKISTSRPDAWLETFSTTPGITLNAVSFNLNDQTYNMEGEIYVPNL